MTFMTCSREQMEEFAAKVASGTVYELIKRGKLTEAEGDDFLARFTPVLLPRYSILAWLREKFFGKEGVDDHLIIFAQFPDPRNK